jgi:hypothetical protein
VHLRQLVADATRTRVQHHPHAAAFVDAHLEEVVARAEGAELLGHLHGLLVCELGRRLVLREPHVRVASSNVVTLTHTGRDRLGDPTEQRLEVIGQPVLGDVELGGDHPTTDVDTHGRGNDGAPGRDHGTDGCADADVRIGHECDMALHDRQACGLLGLADGRGVDVARPGDQLVVHDGGHVTPSLLLLVWCGRRESNPHHERGMLASSPLDDDHVVCDP